ncbi:MAG: hypothetical protein JW750_05140 [Anaerolineaceae bacterium]|nr:hypothetical protein [Anaerolineaceae bacterium]
MILDHPKKLLLIGFGLVLVGFLGPLLTVFGIIPSTFVFNIIFYLCSVAGLMLGTFGALSYYRQHKK